MVTYGRRSRVLKTYEKNVTMRKKIVILLPVSFPFIMATIFFYLLIRNGREKNYVEMQTLWILYRIKFDGLVKSRISDGFVKLNLIELVSRNQILTGPPARKLNEIFSAIEFKE